MQAKRRARKAAKPKARKVSENELHMKCWQWVQKAHPGLLIFHVANERQAAVQFYIKMKRKGVLAGVADFLAFSPGGYKYAIELKDDTGEQEPEQIKFQKRWENTGGNYNIVRTLEEFRSLVGAIAMFG